MFEINIAEKEKMGIENFSLEGKHIVIVGASSGLGRATAVACAECGANVSICARREENLKEVIKTLPSGEHGYSIVDVKSVSSINDGFDCFVDERGPISGMVYAAGISTVRPLSVIDEKSYDETMNINLKGAFFCSKAALKNTRSIRKGSSIVFLSSISSYNTVGKGRILYTASKAGINGLMRSLAIDVSSMKHRSNALIIGSIKTDIWDVDMVTEEQSSKYLSGSLIGDGEPGDVANACIYLLSDASKWVTGAALLVDGGYTLIE
jgi:NAD(P)-dependent dehydrogenase (short-subunit alcohol dehydrogenase family)